MGFRRGADGPGSSVLHNPIIMTVQNSTGLWSVCYTPPISLHEPTSLTELLIRRDISAVSAYPA
jgi:hypothetical protein